MQDDIFKLDLRAGIGYYALIHTSLHAYSQTLRRESEVRVIIIKIAELLFRQSRPSVPLPTVTPLALIPQTKEEGGCGQTLEEQ
jgi:hypothetical protein